MKIGNEAHIEANAAFWDEAASRWRDLDEPAPEEVRGLVARLACQPGDLILDAGCGSGRWSIPLASLGYRVRGLDLSAQMLEAARDKAQALALAPDAVLFQQGDLDHIPFSNGTFDAILCMSVLDFVPSPGDALVELRRVLKPGGRLALRTLGAYSPIRRERWRRFMPGSTVPAIANHILPWEVEALLPELGWSITAQSPRFGPAASGEANNYSQEMAYRLADAVLQQTIATTWEIVAEKPSVIDKE